MNRLKLLLGELVSPNQGSFVPSWKISDNIIICHEVVHTPKEERATTMIVKVDLEKAYDRLEWVYILDTICEVGLPGEND